MPSQLQLDLNNPVFQQQLFDLQKEEQLQVLKILHKISQLSWEDIYRDRGLKWELIHSRLGPHGQKIYSLRISKRFRAIAYRQENWLRLLTLHPNHNSAY